MWVLCCGFTKIAHVMNLLRSDHHFSFALRLEHRLIHLQWFFCAGIYNGWLLFAHAKENAFQLAMDKRNQLKLTERRTITLWKNQKNQLNVIINLWMQWHRTAHFGWTGVCFACVYFPTVEFANSMTKFCTWRKSRERERETTLVVR